MTGTTNGVAGSATLSYTGEFMPVSPTRVLDTRSGSGGISGELSPNTKATFNLTGATDAVPTDAKAVAVNITAVDPRGPGNLRVWPGNVSTVPSISVLNYQPGQTTANFAVIPLGTLAGGDQGLNLYSQGSGSNVLIDLIGYYLHHVRTQIAVGPPASPSVAPTRVVDTRNSGGPIKAKTVASFQVGGVNGLPTYGAADTQAKAIIANVTVVAPKGPGNLRVFPHQDAGTTPPSASNINYIPGWTRRPAPSCNCRPTGRSTSTRTARTSM